MSSVIWALTLLTLASSALCKIPAPVNLTISSRNFIHLLTWEPGPGSPVKLSYTVDLHSLWAATWLNVSGCEEVVSPLVCNLTGAMPNHKDSYYARVKAKLGNQSSETTLEAFKPMEHTYLDPPSVSLSLCGDSLCVGLSPPSNQLRQVYSSLSYTLTVSNGEDGAQYNLSTKGLFGENITNLEPGRKYCITATIENRKSASSQPQCTVAGISYTADREIAIPLCVLVVVVLVVMLRLFYTGCIRSRATLPESLVSVKPREVHLLPPTYDAIACSLLLEEGGAATLRPVAGGQTRESGGEEGEEDEEDESQGAVGAGYERRRGRPGGSSSGGSVLADGRFPPSESAEGYRNASLTGTRGQDSSGSVTDGGPLLSPLSGKGPLTESAAVSTPPSECATDDGPLPLTLTAAELPWGSRAEEEEEGSGLNVNLLSVMLAGQEEEVEEEEEEEEEQEQEEVEVEEDVNKHKSLLLGVSSDPLLVLRLSAADTEPPHTHACTFDSEEEEEEESPSAYLCV